MALVTSGTYGSSPACQYEVYADQISGSDTSRGIRVTVWLKVYGSSSSSRYGYPLNIEMYANETYSGKKWCKGSEYWYATDSWRSFVADIYTDVGTTSSKSITVGFNTSRSDGGSSSWNNGDSGSFTVSSTNTAPTLNGDISGCPNQIIPENTSSLNLTIPEAYDADGNLTGYRLQVNVNDAGYVDLYNGSSRTYSHNIRGYGEGTSFTYRADAYDSMGLNSSGWSVSGTSRKNVFTPHNLSSSGSISYSNNSLAFTFSGAKNTYNNTEFTMSLSSSDITVYNQSVKTSPVTLSIYKSGNLPTGPYIKFEDLKTKFKSTSYKGSITFILTTTNKFGTSKTTTQAISVNLQIAPNAVTNQQISTVQSESTAYLTVGSTSNKYFIPDGSKVIRVKWNSGSGKLGEDIKYELYVAYGSGSWQKVADLIQDTNYYNHVITKQTISQQFKYMVRTICSYNTSLYTDAIATAQTLHFYNSPTLTLGNITRTSNTADVQVTVKSNSSIPNINTVGNWKCCNKGTTTVVSSGGLGQSQTIQIIKITNLSDLGTYDLIVNYKDDTGFSNNLPLTINIGQNLPAFFVNKHGVGVGGVKAESGKELNIKGSEVLSGGIIVGGTATLNGTTNINGITNAKLIKTTGIDVTGGLKVNGYEVYNTGNKPSLIESPDKDITMEIGAGNEVMFGGTGKNTSILFGHRSSGGRPAITQFGFGENGTGARLTAREVTLNGINVYETIKEPKKVPFPFYDTMMPEAESYLIKKDGFVYIHLIGKNGTNYDQLPWWTNVGFIPAEYRPPVPFFGTGVVASPDVFLVAVYINPDTGLLQVLKKDYSETVIKVDICYYVGGGTI